MNNVEESFEQKAIEIFPRIANEVLGDWAMMLTEEADSNALSQVDSDGLFVANLNLKGRSDAILNVVATKEFAVTLHQNLLGDFEESVSDQELMDCLKEMINVAAGRLVSEVFGETEVYDLSDLSCSFQGLDFLNRNLSQFSSITLLGDDSLVGFFLCTKLK